MSPSLNSEPILPTVLNKKMIFNQVRAIAVDIGRTPYKKSGLRFQINFGVFFLEGRIVKWNKIAQLLKPLDFINRDMK